MERKEKEGGKKSEHGIKHAKYQKAYYILKLPQRCNDLRIL